MKSTNTIIEGVPKNARNLIWETFFLSRTRGVNLETHFPWINEIFQTRCFIITENDENTAAATLVLREFHMSHSKRCAMIGMVCVAAKWRGQGLSSQLLENVISFARKENFDALVLWTTQPGIYTKHGFLLDSNEIFVKVRKKKTSDNRLPTPYSIEKIEQSRGLPPFAQSSFCIRGQTASLLAVNTKNGITLGEWKGTDEDVINLAATALPPTWNLNSDKFNTITETLKQRGHSIDPLPCAQRLVLFTKKQFHIPYITILDRI